MIRRVVLGFALTVLLGGVGAMSAHADEPPPPILPPGVATPSNSPSEQPTGPTYVITPGVGGSELPAPSDQTAIDEAKKAEHNPPDDLPGAKIVPTPAAGTDRTAVAGPQTPLDVSLDPVERVGLLWRGFASAVLMLVLIELTVVRRYLLRRRAAGAASA